MGKVITLFGEEEIPVKVTEKMSLTATALPLIPLKKKPSKNDTPLEKEIRRFNRLINELQEYEEEQKEKQAFEDEYHKLYKQQIVPLLFSLAQLKYEYALFLSKIYDSGKFIKKEQKKFTDLIIFLLSKEIEFGPPETKELLRKFLNKRVQLLNKKDKSVLKDMINDEGLDIDSLEDFDIQDTYEQNKERLEKEAFEFHFENEKQKKTKTPEIKDVSILFKELAKQLHPDLEQDENIRERKEQLMKELVKAKRANDLHTMLLIKAAAQQFNNETSAPPPPYSVEQLKKYNRLLQQKVHRLREDYLETQFESLTFSNGFITGFGIERSPQQKVARELLDIEKEIKDINAEMKNITSAEDLKTILNL